MREAIEQYVQREELRERFQQDALKAWSKYQADGKHVGGKEADTWLARLEAGEEDAEPPSPHD
jgi:predicted transcriptional regulator